MKKVLYALGVFMASEVLISCASTKANDENVKSGSDEEFLAQEQVVEASVLEYKQGRNRKKFSLTIDDAMPVISFEGDGGTVRFLVDTGTPISQITRSGVKKILGPAFYSFEKQIFAGF